MAKSRFEYVREFEQEGRLLSNTWIVCRVDGNGFSDFSKAHNWKKPMDQRGVDLMVACARSLCIKFRDVRMAFGQSDEFSFVLPKGCSLWNRRDAKIATSFVSYFASSFVYLWPKYFPDQPLLEPPAFDGRCIVFPSDENLRDYLSWRQADTHINHLLNCCFWALVDRKGLAPKEAQNTINGTSSAQKHEILFGAGVNYNNEPEQYRKGTFLFWSAVGRTETGEKIKAELQEVYTDIIQDVPFWETNKHLLIH